ncbi:MAG: cytidylate kinase [Candidatus Margulisbacteria bacterium GWF2_35_9]|nr:MAG: cytidylate kinase [Candidatus Margulisbacteria bacterium GWF2_35_9]
MSKKTVIAIDGPAASGKSTVARLLADKLKFSYINTGVMYRAITYKCLIKNINVEEMSRIEQITTMTKFTIVRNQILVDGEDLSDKVALQEVAANVSAFSKIPQLRDVLICKQRELAKKHSVIMDGRDIGTVVFPSATYKFYLDASVEIRAKRRYLELLEKIPSENVTLEDIKKELKERDKSDRERIISPLSIADDAIVIDTSKISIDEMVIKLYNIVSEK